MQWVTAAERLDATFDNLRECGRGFELLDRKLVAALKRCVQNCSRVLELYRQISQQEQLANLQDRVLSGRQIYFMILQTFRTNPNMGLVYNIQHFTKLSWLGDDKMEQFQNNWINVVTLQENPLDQRHLAELLFGLMEHSKVLAPDLAEYRRKR